MRRPAPILVVDAAILIAAAFGRSTGAVLEAPLQPCDDRPCCRGSSTSYCARCWASGTVEIVDGLVEHITVVPVEALAFLLDASEMALREAVASRNGSTRDSHVLALAWSADADIWTSDRDFGGTGVPTWSTPNLVRGLAQAP